MRRADRLIPEPLLPSRLPRSSFLGLLGGRMTHGLAAKAGSENCGAADNLLIERLRHGLNEFRAKNELVGAQIALAGVVDWLKLHEDTRALTEPLAKVAFALADLACGKSPPLLAARRGQKKHGRSPHPSHDFRKAVCAHCVDILLQGGRSRNDAGSFVARLLKDKRVNAMTVLGWRDEMGSRNSKMSYDWYKQLRELEEGSEATATAEDKVRKLLEHVDQMI